MLLIFKNLRVHACSHYPQAYTLKSLITRVLSAEIEFSVNIAYFCPTCHRILRNTASLTGRDTIHS